jgi:hypothetical protein
MNIEEVRKMQKILLKITTVALLWCTFWVYPAQAIPTASLKLLDSDIFVGDTFNVQVWADGDGIGQEFLSFGFDIIESGSGVLSFNSYTLNPLFDDDSFFTSLDVAGSTFEGIPDDDVLLATLNYTALAAGSGMIRIEGFPLDTGMSFAGLYYIFSEFNIDDEITLNVSNPVPEPTTIILFGLGLIGLGMSRKKYLET